MQGALKRRGETRTARTEVHPKKRLGQNFLVDDAASCSIVNAIQADRGSHVVEIGPGMGALTRGLYSRFAGRFTALELDPEAVVYLQNALPELGNSLVRANCLDFDFNNISTRQLSLVGNLPYNISSLMLWRVFDMRMRVGECVFMLQREVAQRIASRPGSREYGILSVLLQAFYDASLVLTLPPAAFHPRPKVYSAVLKLLRNDVERLECDEMLLRNVVKGAFNQRRKTLRNSLNAAFAGLGDGLPYEKFRPEALGVEEFIELTNAVANRLAENRKIPQTI